LSPRSRPAGHTPSEHRSAEPERGGPTLQLHPRLLPLISSHPFFDFDRQQLNRISRSRRNRERRASTSGPRRWRSDEDPRERGGRRRKLIIFGMKPFKPFVITVLVMLA